jgi:thioredoxin 1
MFEANQSNFHASVLESDTPVLVDFWADWCPPCKMLTPTITQIATDYEGKLRVVKLDADANPDVVMAYRVMSLPTLLLFKQGQVVETLVGYQPKERITSRLAPHLA